jgi:hypothetical protein
VSMRRNNFGISWPLWSTENAILYVCIRQTFKVDSTVDSSSGSTSRCRPVSCRGYYWSKNMHDTVVAFSGAFLDLRVAASIHLSLSEPLWTTRVAISLTTHTPRRILRRLEKGTMTRHGAQGCYFLLRGYTSRRSFPTA